MVDARSIPMELQKELLRQQAERNKLIVARDAKKIDVGMVNKTRLNLAGFANMIVKRGEEVDALIDTQTNLKIELNVFKMLHAHER